jgi:hypothetical protein
MQGDRTAPRSLALLDAAVHRLGLRNVSPFGINAALGVLAVAGGLVAPQALGGLAGSLLAMQCFVIMAIAMLFGLLLVRQRVASQPTRQLAEGERMLRWIIDLVILSFLLVSFEVGGPFGPLEFLALVGATFLGALRGEHGARELAETGVRCLGALAALLLADALFQLPQELQAWPGARGSVAAAGVYFSLLAVAEKTPLYPKATEQMLALVALLRAPQPPR